MSESIIKAKSYDFALRIVKLYQLLTNNKKEYVMSKQLLKSGTSIGANVTEALQGQSRPDFLSKMNISLKEAVETEYWLNLLHEGGYLNDKEYNSIYNDAEELIKLLVSIVKTTKSS